MRLNLNQRFIAYLLLLGVLPLLVVGGISIQFSRSALESEARSYVIQGLKDKSALLDTQMAQIEALIANISGVEEITNVLSVDSPAADAYTRLATQARIGYVLNNYLNLQGLISIEIFTLSGNHYHVGETLDVGNLDTGARDRLIQETRTHSRNIYWAGIRPNVNGNSQHHSVLVATRMIYRLNRQASRQDAVALLVVNYDPDHIRHHLAGTDSAKSGYMILLDGSDHFVQHPDNTLLGKKAGPELLASLAAGAPTTTGMMVQSTRLRTPQWRLAILVPEEVINRPAREIIRASALVMLASLLLVGIGGFSFLRRVVLPLREITNRFRQLRAEPDSKQQPMTVAGDDEITNLGRGFNDLLDALNDRKAAEEALRHLNLELETRVRERTRDLETSNADLTRARDAAEIANRAKSTFLANMSHELRTPMNGIMGLTSMLQRRLQDPKHKDTLDKIGQSSKHLLHVINDILDISKIEAERLTLEKVNFRVGEILENLMSIVGHRAAEKDLRLLVDLSYEVAGLTFEGDRHRLSQILLNLVGNAIKFTERGTITLRARILEESPNEVLLHWEIQDTGIGVAMEDQKRLFMAFEQADGSMTRKYGGSGLGLVISKRLAQMMGGDMGMESHPGMGSTFWFTVRLGRDAGTLVEVAPTVDNDTAETRIRAGHLGARILLVEDEPINQEVSTELLEDVGLTVDLAEDGAQAVAMAEQNRYRLILMDMQMPKLNGVDATRAIRARTLNASTPILAMTANAFDGDRKICIEAGMNDHIAKPVDPEQLCETLLKWLDKPLG